MSGTNALIIENIPLTSINEIQSIVYCNRNIAERTIGLILELYNSTNDPDLTEVLANTNVITSDVATYRFDFPSLSTYTDFVGENSITNIVNNTFALTEEANVITFPTELTGDVVVGGDLTAENLIVGSTNLITEITALQGRLNTEELKTTALQKLTANHTTDLALNTANILTKQDLS